MKNILNTGPKNFNPIRIAYLVIVITITCVGLSAAQNQQEAERRLKGGLAFSSLNNTAWESSSTPGFVFGLSLGFPLTDAFMVQPEILYIEKGSRETVQETGTEFNLTLDYVEVPVLAKYQLLDSGTIRPNIYAGPYAAFLIENHSDIEQPNSSEFSPDQLVQQAKDSEFGAILGAGADLHFTFNTMSVDLRYSTGLSNVFDVSTSQTIRNGSLIFMVGFSF
ncbi:MAG: porin family protein [Balneolaceae bacterium]|nr:porin family protein [Balneolaceae bacterium]